MITQSGTLPNYPNKKMFYYRFTSLILYSISSLSYHQRLCLENCVWFQPGLKYAWGTHIGTILLPLCVENSVGMVSEHTHLLYTWAPGRYTSWLLTVPVRLRLATPGHSLYLIGIRQRGQWTIVCKNKTKQTKKTPLNLMSVENGVMLTVLVTNWNYFYVIDSNFILYSSLWK